MPAAAPPLCLVWGPAGHGVTDYGSDVVAAAARLDPRLRSVAVSDLDGALGAIAPREHVHLHATDRLLGSSLEAAAAAVEALSRVCRLSLTLHDLPQPSDGTKYDRRVSAYRRFFDAAAAVAVNSDHERLLVSEHLGDGLRPHVIPLGTRVGAAPVVDVPATVADLVVLIAGFVYPGKGHEPALRAAAAAVDALRASGRPVGDAVVRALGAASPGHDDDVAALHRLAADLGGRFEITGFLGDDDFSARLHEPGIPVAAHEHVSASRSMLDWIEAGRRPLVVRSRYSDEMDRLRPGTSILFDPAELAGLLAAAWEDPATTRLEPGHPLRPDLADAAGSYLAWWRGMSR
ncbi:MAG: hypothetical protein K0S49_1112 [Microbacterium sp.]|jgi:hypothetical protein|uniref:hypothetical protein n=1 Tax=Microbacterium sp. AG238 TaxID=2183994 RepID=UPI000E734C59|nr:hypothetical protein [Microbacterium sp. AG238]MDF2579533.1 hypothetical protein [Microbacterium sp.]RKE64081.1 hypothetical protein DEU36_1302 [Microbacterium sp. AG238]